jgi:UDP-sulfoquinovose synthase
VRAAGARAGLGVKVQRLQNPRIEMEEHYYNATHSRLIDLGLKPNLLTDGELDVMLSTVRKHCHHVDPAVFQPRVKWARRRGSPETVRMIKEHA